MSSTSSQQQHVDVMAVAVEHCQDMAQRYPDLAVSYQQLAQEVSNKLWHQLTVTLLEFVSNPVKNGRMMEIEAGDDDNEMKDTHQQQHSFWILWEKVVIQSGIAKKMNRLSLARIASFVALALAATTAGSSSSSTTSATTILENLLSLNLSPPLGVPATIFLQSKLMLLRMNSSEGAHSLLSLQEPPVEEDKKPDDSATTTTKPLKIVIQETIKTNSKLLQEMQMAAGDNDGIAATTTTTTSTVANNVTSEAALVHGAHYDMCMTYYKAVGPPEAFYDACISYLNYTPLSQIDHAHALAVDLCLAALTGDGVYNLGQVLTTPIVQLLLLQDPSDPASSSFQWLLELLKACSSGNVTEFQRISTAHAADIQRQPALVHRAAAVQEKLTLLALVNMVFERPSMERNLSFDEIAQRLQLPTTTATATATAIAHENQVEWIVMRAFSVGLLQGSMDQVDQTVQVTLVVPRILTSTEMSDLAVRFGDWRQKVAHTQDYMVQQTTPFL